MWKPVVGEGGGAVLGGGGECECGRKRLDENTVWMTDNEIEILFLGFPTYICTILRRALSHFLPVLYIVQNNLVLTALHTMIAFIFMGFRIKNSVQTWLFKFSWVRF